MTEPLLSIVPRTPDAVASEAVIDLLERYVQLAKDGDLVGVAITGYDRGRAVTTALAQGENPTLLLGGLSRMTYRLNEFIEKLTP